ncbi:hypothetical protein [Acidimangrovimonas sediminis]|uniref:hypothetical protein n=1 Tax=Acidimangrovimonas sediminis TaxID=2056283 RepID=UPI000C80CF47|nr:hypothetical protein [Acidimangrovimonas sediminis]
MLEHLPVEVRQGLEMARKREARKRSRLRVHVGETVYPVLRLWESGFALDAETDPHLRGLVDIYDGSRHLYQALIVASNTEAGEVVCDFKRATPALDRAPLDFVRPDDAPSGLLPKR